MSGEGAGRQVVERWTPTVGQQVRLVLTPECILYCHHGLPGDLGVIVVNIENDEPRRNSGHPYGVELNRAPGKIRYLAAQELEPVEPPARPGDEGDGET